MTIQQVKEILQPAEYIHFNTNLNIDLLFPYEHESNIAFEAVGKLFKDIKVHLHFEIVDERIVMTITDKKNLSVKTKGLIFSMEKFNINFVNADKSNKIKLFCYHLLDNNGGFARMKTNFAVIAQNRSDKKLDIVDFTII